jgi:molecular chaperone DnaK (HSP70)
MTRVGDPVPLVLGGGRYLAESLAATLAGWLVDIVAEGEGGPADRIVLTHPPSWGPHRRGVLHQALEEAGLPGTLLLPGPVAAAEIGFAAERPDPGSVIAVCRLGAEHVESAVLRPGPGGFETLARAESAVLQAGARIDELVADHVLARAGVQPPDPADPEARGAMARLRATCAEAKERLSLAPDAYIPVPLPGSQGDVHLSRSELEHLARPVLSAAMTQLRRITSPVPDDRLAAVLLVGGSARIPLVSELAEDAFGELVRVDPDPGTALCRGATLAALPRMAPDAEPARPAPGAGPPPEWPGRTAEAPPHGTSTALATRESAELAVLDDDLGDPPPRPPVVVTPLEPPKKFALGRGTKARDSEKPKSEKPKREKPIDRDEDTP